MKKLIEIQNELKAPKNHYNSFGKYKYRSCEDILEALKPLLKKYECTLTISDTIKDVSGLVFVEAYATISDGETEVGATAQAGIDPNKKGMDIAQSFGSSSSYARKYALNGLFLIDDTKDADTQKPPQNANAVDLKQLELKIIATSNIEELTNLYNSNAQYATNKEATELFKRRKKSFTDGSPN